MLSEKTLSTFVETNQKFKDTGISEMFDFKYKEDVEVCFSKLKLKKLETLDPSPIDIKSTDGLIAVSYTHLPWTAGMISGCRPAAY